MKPRSLLNACCLCLAASVPTHAADFISPNGYSGLGLTPSSDVITTGTGVFNYDTVVPGWLNTKGHNIQVGFGIFDDIELIGRLATNDLKCNMFSAGACPPNTIRDFSPSLKWTLPLKWLTAYDAKVAVGVTDIGGAAVLFRSEYVVASKRFDQFELSLGRASTTAPAAVLDGNFGAVSWSPAPWSQLTVEKIGANTWAHAAITAPITDGGTTAWLSYNRQLTDSALTEKQWISLGISVPLDKVSQNPRTTPSTPNRALTVIKPVDLADALVKNGFHSARIGWAQANRLVVEVDSGSYQWDILDAVGVATGVIAGAYSDGKQDFDLLVSTRGIGQVLVRSNSTCIKAWFEAGDWCEQLHIESLNTNPYDTSQVAWADAPGWKLRPEAVFIPNIISAVGTEYGAFDFDLALNLNTVVPLWKGAYFDHAQIYPTNTHSENFEPGRPFYASRYTQYTSRRALNQLFSLPVVNTQGRLTVGTVYRNWAGAQIETSTQTGNGRHKLGLSYGSFKNDTLSVNAEKTYQLVNYRYALTKDQRTSTELTAGKFWAGDTGYLLGQRFWHGDTSLTMYLRRTRMSDTQPLVSFAGLQLSLPLAPRKNAGFAHLDIRGANQWSYALETKILDTNNRLTGGYGEVPNLGASMAQTFNRDRNTSNYYEGNLGRIKDAFIKLSAD